MYRYDTCLTIECIGTSADLLTRKVQKWYQRVFSESRGSQSVLTVFRWGRPSIISRPFVTAAHRACNSVFPFIHYDAWQCILSRNNDRFGMVLFMFLTQARKDSNKKLRRRPSTITEPDEIGLGFGFGSAPFSQLQGISLTDGRSVRAGCSPLSSDRSARSSADLTREFADSYDRRDLNWFLVGNGDLSVAVPDFCASASQGASVC